MLTTFHANVFGQSSEGEISVGLETSLVKTDTSSRTYSAVAVGGGVVWKVLGTHSLDVDVHLFPTVCFGNNVNDGFDITQFHLPLGLLLRYGEYVPRSDRMTIGGAVGMGYQYTASMLATGATDMRPYLEVEIMLGVFKRGMFKCRYTTVLTSYIDAAGGAVSYHSVNLIGSTSW